MNSLILIAKNLNKANTIQVFEESIKEHMEENNIEGFNQDNEHRIRYFRTSPSALISGPDFPIKNIEKKFTNKQRFLSLLKCNGFCQK